MTAQEEMLVKGSSRGQCFTCRSAHLRPLIVLAKEGFPPGDPDHNITYSHDAIFGCNDCHHGYAEVRRHDCFDFEEVFDQNQVCALDRESIASLTKCLARCPEPTSEKCACKVHKSLRSSWSWLPRHIWDRYTGDFPAVLLQIADPDQERLVISGVWVKVAGDVPKLAPKNGKWRAYDAKGNIQSLSPRGGQNLNTARYPAAAQEGFHHGEHRGHGDALPQTGYRQSQVRRGINFLTSKIANHQSPIANHPMTQCPDDLMSRCPDH